MIPFSVSSCGKIFSASLQDILIDGCNFGAPLGGDEFRVFLFHRLGCLSPDQTVEIHFPFNLPFEEVRESKTFSISWVRHASFLHHVNKPCQLFAHIVVFAGFYRLMTTWSGRTQVFRISFGTEFSLKY